MKRFFDTIPVKTEMSDFMKQELDIVVDLIKRNIRNELTPQEKVLLADKKNRYVAYKEYIDNQVNNT